MDGDYLVDGKYLPTIGEVLILAERLVRVLAHLSIEDQRTAGQATLRKIFSTVAVDLGAEYDRERDAVLPDGPLDAAAAVAAAEAIVTGGRHAD